MSDIVIGIDLGTTNSCAACYINGRIKIFEPEEGDRITPSYIFFTEKNQAIVGKYAKRMADTNKPEYGVYEVKRLVGRKFDDPYVQNNLQYFSFTVIGESNEPIVVINRPNGIGEIKKSPEQLCTVILGKIKKDVESKLNKTITKAVITVPAYFNVSQREVTLAAAKKAGFTVLKLLNEPTAAALSYYLENDNNSDDSYSLVYDLGGGTFDVAILKKSSNNIDIICVDGDTHLGGKDLDNLIVDYVCDTLKREYKYNPKLDRMNMRRLQNECEEAKKMLSNNDETFITLRGFTDNPHCIEIPLTRECFENMADNIFRRTMKIVENCLKSSNIPKSEIKEIILSGGSSRVPKIRSLLSEIFDERKLNKFANPDECVGEGAAIQAAILSKNPLQEIKKLHITDVTPLSLGASSFVDSMTFLIKKNTTIPASGSSKRITINDQQKLMTFDIYEGERTNALKNRYLGKLSILDITPAPPGQCEVTLTLKLDENGILTVSAKEKYRDNFKDLKIDYSRGCRSDSEVVKALQDAEDYQEEDELFTKFASEKEYVLTYCIRAIYNFESKNLTNSYKEAYELCKEIKKKTDGMGIECQEKLKLLKKEVKRRCDSIVREFDFDFMPTSC